MSSILLESIGFQKITRIGESMAGQDRREQTQIMPKRQELALFGEPKRFRKDGGGGWGGEVRLEPGWEAANTKLRTWFLN